MGVRILHDREDEQAVLFCSTTSWGFGPVFSPRGDASASEHAEAFVKWLGRDPRALTDADLEAAYSRWLAEAMVPINGSNDEEEA